MSTRSDSRSLPYLLGLILLVGVIPGGCSRSTGPASPQPDAGEAQVSGVLDPGAGTFVLQTLDAAPPDRFAHVPVQLIGSNLQIDPTIEIVSLDVAIHNQGDLPLYAPAVVWLTRFLPPGVTVINADLVVAPDDTIPSIPVPLDTPPPPSIWGFEYSALLGGDEVLQPGETSGTKTWEFHVPDLVAFSFAARATFGLVQDLPRLAGLCFEDRNRNGIMDRGEDPAPGGTVRMRAPEGQVLEAHPGPAGRYVFPIETAGLYQLRYLPPLRPHFLDPHFTTPNPLQVLVTQGPDGRPRSYLTANFGVFWESPFDTVPAVILVDGPPDSLVNAPYQLQGLEVEGDILHLQVAFSGCQPVHPFSLYMDTGFMESLPVQANMYLDHELDEDCEAYFQAHLRFDLAPVRQAHIDAYGEPGVVILHLFDYEGQSHDFRFGP